MSPRNIARAALSLALSGVLALGPGLAPVAHARAAGEGVPSVSTQPSEPAQPSGPSADGVAAVGDAGEGEPSPGDGSTATSAVTRDEATADATQAPSPGDEAAGAAVPTSPSGEAPAAAPDATPADPEPEPEPDSRPALDWVGSATNGAIVSVHAPEGALPEGTVPSVSAATPEQARAALEASSALLDGEPVDALAVDVSFSRGGAEVEPAPGSAVEVTIRSIAPVSGTRFSCVHVADDGSAEVVATATPTHAEFASDSFSVYAIVGADAQVRARVAFVSATDSGAVAGATLSTQIVRAGDSLEAPAPPAAAAEGSVFSHWTVGTGTDVADVAPWLGRALSNDDIASLARAAGSTLDPATNLYDLTATAAFAPAHTVRFHQYTREECGVDPSLDSTLAFSSLTDASGSIALSGASLSFTPVVEGVDAHLVGWASYADASAGPTAYGTDDAITGVDSDLDLYPVLSTGFFVELDTSGASVLESVFVQEAESGSGTLEFGRLPTEQSLAGDAYDPATGTYAEGYRGWHQGWTLEGWYRTRTGSAEEGYEYSGKVEGDLDVSSDLTLYARWVPRDDTPYTVINMIEGADGAPGEGTYTRYSAVAKNAATGTSLTAADCADAVINGYHVADVNDTGEGPGLNAQSVSVTGDGQTLRFVYWNRNWFKPSFSRLGITYDAMVAKGVSRVKIGESSSVWDPDNTVLSAMLAKLNAGPHFQYTVYATVHNIDDIIVWADSTEMTFPTPGPPVVHGGSVDFGGETTWNPAYRYILRHFVEQGKDATKTPDKTISIGGTSYRFDLDSSEERRSAYDGNVQMTYGNTIFYSDGLYNVGYSNGSETNVVAAPAATSTSTVNKYTKDGKRYVDYYYARTRPTLSFQNISGINLDADFSSRTCVFDEPLNVYDPGATAQTTRRVGDRTYAFAGWYADSSAASNPEAEWAPAYLVDMSTATMPSTDTILYASWTPVTHGVTFDSVGGQMAPEQGATLSDDKSTLTYAGVESGERLVKPATPTKTVGGVEYTFVGWYKDPDYAEAWNFQSSTVQGPTTLYAKWVKGRSYRIAYHDSDGTEIEGVDDTLYRYGARARVAPEQEGDPRHDEPFLGWSTVRGNASYLVGQSVTVGSQVDLFAVYGSALPGAAAGDVEEGAPRVNLHSNYASLPGEDRPGAEVESTIQAERANAAVTLPSGVAGARAEGYHVSGWATTPDAASADHSVGERVAVASDTDLYAVWEANRLSAALSATLAYDGTEHKPEPTVTGWDGSTLVSGTDYELSWSNNEHAGTATVTVTGKGEYKRSEPATAAFAISPRKVTLTADNKSSRVKEPVETLTASVTAGSLVREGDLGTVSAHVSGEIDTSEAGAYVILVSYTSNPDYEVTVVPGTYRVSAASLLVTAQGWSGTYDGRPHSATVSLSPAVEGATVWYSTTTPLNSTNYSTAGRTEAPSQTGADSTTVYYYVVGTESYQPDERERAGSVVIDVSRAPLTCTAQGASVTYGGGAPAGSVSWSGFVAGEGESAVTRAPSFSFRSASGEPYAAGSPAGSYRIEASGAEAVNNEISYVPGTLTVARRSLSLEWSATDSMPYTGSARTYAGATLSGVLEGDDVSCDLSGASATRAGDYVATVTGLAGARASSYSQPGEGLSHPWSITRAANSATAAIDDWTYDGTSHAAPTAIAGFGAAAATFEYAESADAGHEGWSADPPTSAGTHWVRAVVPGTPDYEGATSPAKSFGVARRPLLIDGVSAAGKVYDGTSAAPVSGEPALAGVAGVAASGPVAGDDVAAAPGAASFEDASAGTGRVVTFSGWSLSGAAAANYELAAQPADSVADILRRPARVVARSYAASYGDEPPAYAADWENLAPGEGPADAAAGTLSLSCAYARWSDAGEYPIVPSGVAATANYSLEPVAGALSVARAGNRWVAGPSMASWTLGEPVPAPVAQAAFGEASLSFAPALSAQDEGDGWSPDVPTAPGPYVMRAEVEGTRNYSGLSAEVPFSVSAATLSYDANSPLATGAVPPAEGAVGESVEVAGAGGLAWPGHSFRGWNAAPDGSGDAYQPGDPFTLTGGPDVLYAQWLPAGELRYEGNGADSGETPPNLGNAGEVVRAAACGFSRVGHRFAGWGGSADGSGERVMPGDAVTLVAGGQRLFAQWEVNEISAALAGGPFALPADGSGARPRPTVLGWDGRVLSEGVDYELSWADNLAPTAGGPRASVTVTPLPGTEHALARPVTIEFDVVAAAALEPAPEAAPADSAAVPADPTTPSTGDAGPGAVVALLGGGIAVAGCGVGLRRRRRTR